MEPLEKTIDKSGKKENTEELVHDFNNKKNNSSGSKLIVLLIVIFLLGIASGYFFTGRGVSGGGVKITGVLNSVAKGTTEGSTDTSTFKDTAEGTLKTGGIDGEGAFHLVRPGGDSQNVYLTSSIVDLSKYVNQKLKVWGQTQKAQHAGWLMDVGKIQVL